MVDQNMGANAKIPSPMVVHSSRERSTIVPSHLRLNKAQAHRAWPIVCGRFQRGVRRELGSCLGVARRNRCCYPWTRTWTRPVCPPRKWPCPPSRTRGYARQRDPAKGVGNTCKQSVEKEFSTSYKNSLKKCVDSAGPPRACFVTRAG